MKRIISKILILLMLFSIVAELSGISFNAITARYVMKDIDESDKKEKEEVEKDKLLAFSSFNIVSFKKEAVAGFFIPYISVAFKFLPEIPPKQV